VYQSKPAIASVPTLLKIVVIDAGHGGKDPGAIGKTGVQEKQINLDIARRVKSILAQHQVKVIMTRDKDEFISLQDRTEIASRSKADLFVSIHANASSARSLFGLEVYCSKELDYTDRHEEQRLLNRREMKDHLAIWPNDPYADDIIFDLLDANKWGTCDPFADQVAESMSDYLKTKNLGGKRARFFVLRNTLIPAILVEVGFLTNPKEERLLKTSNYRQKIAYGLVKSILMYGKQQYE
ncbi:MAG: N-acetylmuramoyl-L-alanine amidase, partial [Candidatus Omnitrophota bacterium]|nr:N-acetylmuramoyl-L-alanine amidase [Candidatus Omnitrophota bacterium]